MTDRAGAGQATRLRRAFLLLHGLRWLPTGIVIPVTVLVLQERGLSLGEVGLAMGAFSATTMAAELPTGGLADSVGRRPVLVVAALIDAGALTLVLTGRGLTAMVVASIAGGLARALDSGPLEAWFVDRSRTLDPTVALGRGLAAAGVVEGSVLAAGAVLGGFLPRLDAGLAAAVVAAIALRLASVIAVVALMTEDPIHRAALPRPALRVVLGDGVRVGVGDPGVRRLLLATGATGLSLFAIELLWQPRFTDLLGREPTDATGVLGLLIAVGFVAAAAGSSLAPWVARTLGNRRDRAAVAAHGARAVAIAGLALTTDPIVAGVALVASYLLLGAIGPLHQELLHDMVPATRRATMLSVDSLSGQGGGLAGALTAGWVADAAGVPWAWALAAVVVAASAGLYRRSAPSSTGDAASATSASGWENHTTTP